MRRTLVICLALVLSLSTLPLVHYSGAQQRKYQTLGYRSCGTERGTCHQSDGDWWQNDAHSSTVKDLKRKKQKALRIAQAYGLNPADYLKGNTKCAECHGEVVSGRENKNMNTGVSCESCHGPSGPKAVGYFEVHQEGALPKDPLSTNRVGYQKALRVGLVELRNVNVRAFACVRCHQINEKRLLEANHPTGEGFDYVKGIKNDISEHWDYKLRNEDLDEAPYNRALRTKPIPQFTVKLADLLGNASNVTSGTADTIYIYVDPTLPPWLNPKNTISIKSFNPQISKNAPMDSILLEIKKYIEYIHDSINKNE